MPQVADLGHLFCAGIINQHIVGYLLLLRPVGLLEDNYTMRIERFRIQGFKSIVDLTVDGLSDINVFFGLNDVGKSNIFEALKLWQKLLLDANKRSSSFPDQMRSLIEDNFFRLRGDGLMSFDVNFEIGTETFRSRIQIKKTDTIEYENLLSRSGTQGYKEVLLRDEKDRALLSKLRLSIIDAERRFQSEHRQPGSQRSAINAQNLKQGLFYTYLSSDIKQKERFNAIKQTLAAQPYKLGELDVALNPINDAIDIGFVRPDGRIPLESLGSGVQQLLLVLGQIFLNDFPIIAVEEPEMNLSPRYQAQMISTLETLLQNPAIELEQLFISTHSPYFEFTQNFYDVTYDPVKGTQIQRATSADYNQHFAIIPTGSDTGARLNSMNQVVLYDGVIKDLGLQRGDLVIFARNDAGRWEIRTGRELANELQQVTNGSVQ